jgi:hypothetical protein
MIAVSWRIGRPQRIGDGCVAMIATVPACGATGVASILMVGPAGLAYGMACSNGETP